LRYSIITTTKKNSGFSLVEVMVVAALIGGLAVVLATMNKNVSKTSTKAQADSDIMLATNEIVALLANPSSCAATFGATFNTNGVANTGTMALPVPDASIPAMVYKPTATAAAVSRYVKNTLFGTSNREITAYSLTAVTGRIADLAITYKLPVILGGSGSLVRIVKIYYELNGGFISACRSLSTMSSEIWSRGSGTNILYNGKVLLGPGVAEQVTVPSYANAALVVRGGIRALGGVLAASQTIDSDVRLKKDIRPIKTAANSIYSLRGVTYLWNDVAFSRGIEDESRQMGVLAQDVEKVFPEAVTNSSDGFKSVNYSGLVAPLIETVKDLHSQNELQNAEVMQLREENKNIKAWICRQDKNTQFCSTTVKGKK
jgi:prepilin-type N-terminal cleavage/methylation domain-containing protein